MEPTADIIIKPNIFADTPGVRAGQSTRKGGVSPAPWHSLNLGKSTGDSLENVAENRQRFCQTLGFDAARLAWSKQVHGDQIRIVTEPGGAEGFDALVTNVPGILLAVSVADCTPILVYDEKCRAIAAIHAGWKGTASGIVLKTLNLMQTLYGTSGSDCKVFIGACIDECSFEVGDEVADQFDSAHKRFDPARQKYFVDLKKANAQQCLGFGIAPEHIEISPFCTVQHNELFFSHRKEKGVTGRMMAAIGLLIADNN